MVLLTALLIALSLCMDNLAVTVAAGCAARGHVPWRDELKASTAFSVAHLIMLSGGWLLGAGVGKLIHAYAVWVSCGILVWIGAHMMWHGRPGALPEETVRSWDVKSLVYLAVATSIDAWLVGMSLALTQVPFLLMATLMVLFVFITSWIGFYFGAWLGEKFGHRMEMLGGFVLILLGVKLLLEGLGIW
ncbi:MAG: manganese efflux pump [Elusimicrobiaceae bacterium]|nr:manganese efflux pump [Elusimicrobiaceae bacterium]